MKKRYKFTNTQIIALGFAAIIMIGTFLLSLPISSKSGTWTPFEDSLLTATSATCVTGLAVYDTGAHWTTFGQLVIITLIQIGGLGFMTIITMFSFFTKRQISMRERHILMQSAGNMNLGGIVKLIKRIIIGTFIIEGMGAVLLSIVFVPEIGAKGIYYAVFHSISAFCNAGFDILSNVGSASLSGYANNVLLNVTVMLLIIIGGIGFLVWSDILKWKFKFRKYELHSKIVLVTTAVLLILGAVVFFFTERNYAFRNMGTGESILASVFQSVTTRTAGFYSVPQGELSNSGTVMTILLMFIGGSPGSTAGGIKTTTFAVIIVSTIACARNRDSVTVFKRRIADDVVRQSTAIVSIYMAAVLASSAVICALEPITLRESLYEVVSAIGTVGLSMDVTPTLCTASKIIITVLMYAGRLGGLSLVMALAEKREKVPINRPVEKILIG